MDQTYLALAARVDAFALDEPRAAEPFSRRLARENGWSEAYTGRVVREYKRFLTLAATATDTVCPSEQVDQAWHLHVLHTARYQRFCSEVLGRRVEHAPSEGGTAERAQYVRAYERTLSTYQERFGELPPSDVWPNARRRFTADVAVRRVNTSEHWVVRKPLLWARLPARWRSPHVGARVLVATDDLSAFPLLEPYALARLAGGPTTALDSAVTSLIARGCVELERDGRTLLAKRAAPPTAPTFEHDVYTKISSSGKLRLRDLRRQATTLSQPLTDQLLKAELIAPRRSPLLLCLALVASSLSGLWLLNRLAFGTATSLLVVLTVSATVLAICVFRWRGGRTARGEATLAQARQVHEPLQGRATASALAENGTLPVMLALFGTAAIVGLSRWRALLDRKTALFASADCGASCGGDGDGDGDGGCGGGCGGGD